MEQNSPDDIRSASAALKEALAGLTKAIGAGAAGVGSAVSAEVTAELRAAQAEIARDLREAAKDIGGATVDVAGALKPKPQSARAAKAEKTRADLIAAAARVFAEKGYEAASVADLASAAGYTKGALYAHFPSKADLFKTMITEAGEVSAEHVEQAWQADTGEEAFEHHDLAGALISLEAYLFALRHPEDAGMLVQLAETQIAASARQAMSQRIGTTDGDPTQEDVDNALAVSAFFTIGTIFREILPGMDVTSSFERVTERLFSSSASAEVA
jgi:AcrR family transcriptional regulator